MDSTNNEIYKIAKYLDKYTKYGNKEGGVYLQKLDNYLHKVQYGGNGIVDLAQQIGVIVDEVVKRHQQVKGKLELLLDDASNKDLESKIQNKIKKLEAQKEGLVRIIAEKKAEKEKLATKASSALAPAPAPAPKASSASEAPASASSATPATATPASEAVSLYTITEEELIKLEKDQVYNLVCKKAEIDPNTDGLREAFTGRIDAENYKTDWNFKDLINELYTDKYFKEDDNIINLMKMILVLLQLRARFLAGSAPSEIEEIDFIIKHLTNNQKDITIFNQYIKEKIFEKEVYTFTFNDFRKFKASPVPAPESAPASSAPVLRERVPLTAKKQEQQALAKQLATEVQEKKIRREAQNLADGKSTNYDELTTDTFDVMGYIVNPQTGKVDEDVYTFPGEQKSVKKDDGNSREINVLQSLLQQSIIDALQITGQTKTGSFNLNRDNTIFRIKLDNLNIRKFVDKINKKEIVVKLTTETGETTNVRLFVKPMTYPEPTAGKELTEEQQQINEFAEIISKAIRLLVAQPPPKQPQGVEV